MVLIDDKLKEIYGLCYAFGGIYFVVTLPWFGFICSLKRVTANQFIVFHQTINWNFKMKLFLSDGSGFSPERFFSRMRIKNHIQSADL